MKKVAPDKLATFFAQYKHLHYKKGDVILRSEDPPRGVFYLTQGYVRQHSISEDGKDFTFIIFMPEDFFPIIWALQGTPIQYSLEAMTHIEAQCAPREDFLAFLEANPDVLLDLTRRVLVRMGGLMTRMEYLVFGNAFSKVASIILICAQRFGQQSGKGTMIPFSFPHRAIASLVGISRETASIEIKKIERMGLITYHGRHVIVTDCTKLRQAAQITY